MTSGGIPMILPGKTGFPSSVCLFCYILPLRNFNQTLIEARLPMFLFRNFNPARIAAKLFMFFLSIFLFSDSGICESTITINSDMQYQYALDRFEQQDFQTAVVEFNRFIYFFPKDSRLKEAAFKKGVALFHSKRYEEALVIFRDLSGLFSDKPDYTNGHSSGDPDSVSSSSKDFISAGGIAATNDEGELLDDDTLSTEACFMLSAIFLAVKRDASAQMVLQNFLLLNDDPAEEDRAYYALVWIYLARARDSHTSYKESRQALTQAIEYIDKMTPEGRHGYKAGNLAKEISRTAEFMDQNKKSPVVAGIASVIPGGGFAYCNRYRDAVAAFLLNSVFVLAALESFEDGNEALGGLIGFVGSGFYGGSIYGGISSAHKQNRAVIINAIDGIRKNTDAGHDSLYGIMKNTDAGHDGSYDNLLYDDDRQKKSSRNIPLLSIKIPF
ncbi:MAG: hypothetical protein HQK61_04660, partial [Desulfamplus sp.]|nr:hypothetical protein [Desulfamplus sp.]